MGGAVDENVRGHQARIGKQAQRGAFAVLAGLVLELRHAVHPADARHAVEDPGKLRMLRNGRLVEDDMLDRIDSRRDERGRDRADLVAQVIVHELGGDGMQIDDAINAVVVLLQRHEFADGAKIVAEMQVPGRLDAREDERLEGGHGVLNRLVEGPRPKGHVANDGAYARRRLPDQVEARVVPRPQSLNSVLFSSHFEVGDGAPASPEAFGTAFLHIFRARGCAFPRASA